MKEEKQQHNIGGDVLELLIRGSPVQVGKGEQDGSLAQQGFHSFLSFFYAVAFFKR